MNVKEILRSARTSNIDISISGDNLQVKSGKAEIPPALLEAIRNNKSSIISYLRANAFDAGRQQSIPAIAPRDGYVLSSSQMRLWVLCQFKEASIAYNLPEGFIFEGELHVAALQQAFAALVERHEILRTVFREDAAGDVRQFVLSLPESGMKLHYRDLRTLPAPEKALEQMVQSEAVLPFDLSTGPLLRVNLYQLATTHWVLTYTIHHIICDGWSMSIIIKELFELYHAYLDGQPNPLPPLRIQYKDFAAWQQEQMSGERAKADRAFWLDQFRGDLPVLDLPGSKSRPAIRTYNGEAAATVIDTRTTNKIKELSQEHGCTFFMGIMAAITALLSRYTGLHDIILGTTIAGRGHVDLENQIGFYVNTLALRMDFGNNSSFRDLLDNAKKVTLGAYEHQLYPFDTLVNELKLRRDTSRHPLFDIEIVWQFTDAGASGGKALENVTVKEYSGMEKYHGVFDLVFKFVEVNDGLYTNIIFNSDVFDRPVVERMLGHLTQLVQAMAERPAIPIHQLEYLSEAEKHELLHTFNDTEIAYPEDNTIIWLFEQQAAKTPAANAVVFGDCALSYKELNEEAERLAMHLKLKAGISANDLVCTVLDRSEKAIITMLGIMKSGTAYVPIDPAYPEARRNYILNDTAARVIITEEKYRSVFDAFKGELILIDADYSHDDAAQYQKPVLKLQDLAYVIYTSGSTGNPKGVMIQHGAILNTIHSQKKIFNVQEGERGLQFSSLSFDASVWEMFMLLVSGGTLFIVDEECKKNPQLMEQFIANNKIGIATISPVYFQFLETSNISTLKTLITAGEAAIADKAIAFSAHGDFYNAYGPTETSICATVYQLPPDAANMAQIPIGKPLPNTQVYITDDNMNLLPAGAIGEICVGGKGLALGYLNNPALTQEKFVSNLFRPGEKLYKTGDLGKFLPDGNIEFAGRKDHQLKIHGYRIEPGEIESALQSHPDIEAAAVIATTNADGHKQLVAFITAKSILNTQEIRAWLGKTMPQYMVPDMLIQLHEFPITTNGKLDRKKLPELISINTAATENYVPPANEIEEQLADIWQELLGREKIGVHDNFFEAGGNSVKVIRLAKAISKKLSKNISITSLFQYPNIKDLASFIAQQTTTNIITEVDTAQMVQDLNKFKIESDVIN